jgi:SAM-dependent methyltransferase
VDHSDHVGLIRDGVIGGPNWADLGSGHGAFTLALADLLGPRGRIVSVDRDRGALRTQTAELRRRFPKVAVEPRVADFSEPLGLHGLDGVVMANSLHFIEDKGPVLALVRGYLRDGGRLILVEYDADRGNPWVPHPLSFETWRAVAAEAGLGDTRRLASVPSRFLAPIYAAVSLRPGPPSPS